jgi:hypothetical protein
MRMLAYLNGYVQAPEWDHALDIVPMAVAAPPPAWPHWQPDALRDEGLQNHLLRSLRHWSAFRPLQSAGRGAAEAALSEGLPQFISDVQTLPNARRH